MLFSTKIFELKTLIQTNKQLNFDLSKLTEVAIVYEQT